ncbi:Uncharacterised protein [Vibrio cholerae]|nr:Uncharacterised protein [Vibrio cholerae]CSI00148.1 Uncharacterised protein [Vibrio cholerae]CSI34881.1 Uncharacterised protein [Vibrio cholerae]
MSGANASRACAEHSMYRWILGLFHVVLRQLLLQRDA